MRRGLGIAVMLLLGACQAAGPTAPKDRRIGGSAPASPAAGASAGASPGARVAASATPAGPADLSKLDRLRAPAAATTKLAGTIRVDAASLVAAGAGNVLSHNGAQIVAAGGLNMVAAGAGNLVAAGGLNLVAAGGLNLVAGPGGSIVAAGAGNIVGPNGGQLVAAGGLNYHLAQAAAPSAGTQLPAAGMLVSVASLTTRKYLPLGQDAQGQPVYAVLSDVNGGYELFVEEGSEANLLVIAQPPGKPDPRLVFNVFTPREGAGPRVVDENGVAGTRYLRTCMIARFAKTLVSDDPEALVAMFKNEAATMPGIETVLARFARHYRAIAVAKGIGPQTDPKVVEAMAVAMADAALAMLDIEGITMSAELAPAWKGDRNARAVEVLGKAMADLHARGGAYLRDPADPTRYRERIDAAFLARVNNTKTGERAEPIPPLIDPARRFLAPADFSAFVVDEYLAPHRELVWSPLSNLYAYLEPDPAADPAASRAAGDAWSDTIRSAAAALAGTLALNLAPLGDAADAKPATSAGLAADAAARAFEPSTAK